MFLNLFASDPKKNIHFTPAGIFRERIYD